MSYKTKQQKTWKYLKPSDRTTLKPYVEELWIWVMSASLYTPDIIVQCDVHPFPPHTIILDLRFPYVYLPPNFDKYKLRRFWSVGLKDTFQTHFCSVDDSSTSMLYNAVSNANTSACFTPDTLIHRVVWSLGGPNKRRTKRYEAFKKWLLRRYPFNLRLSTLCERISRDFSKFTK